MHVLPRPAPSWPPSPKTPSTPRRPRCGVGARAVAAWELWQHSGASLWLVQAAEYAHEAKEHAGGGPPGTLLHVCAELHALTRGTL